MSFQNRGLTRFHCDYINTLQHGKEQFLQETPLHYSQLSAASGPVYEIYLKNISLTPNYGGHVPGAKFRYGQTFGHDSIDTKRTFKEIP